MARKPPFSPFDIEKWRAVQAIEADDVKFPIAHSEDIDGLRGNRIGAWRGAQAEHADRLIAHTFAGRALDHVPPGPMKPLQHQRFSAHFEARQTRGEFRAEADRTGQKFLAVVAVGQSSIRL